MDNELEPASHKETEAPLPVTYNKIPYGDHTDDKETPTPMAKTMPYCTVSRQVPKELQKHQIRTQLVPCSAASCTHRKCTLGTHKVCLEMVAVLFLSDHTQNASISRFRIFRAAPFRCAKALLILSSLANKDYRYEMGTSCYCSLMIILRTGRSERAGRLRVGAYTRYKLF